VNRRSHRAGLGFALALLLSGADALAFCRTTTCDPSDPREQCQLDANQCVTTGLSLAWRSSCVTIGVQADGSPRNGFSYDDIADVVEKSFGAWMNADCGDGAPSIDVKLIGPISCGVSEYNSDRGNANIVLFREDEWPYAGAANAIGLTTTRFDTKTGELWDADIELNDVSQTLSIGEPVTASDLQSVLTHEAGHFLGLSHSNDPAATMRAIYDPSRDGTSFRSLDADDVNGICAIYPTERKVSTASCGNRHGFSSDCGADQPEPAESKGCSVSSSAPGGDTWLAAAAAGALFAFRGRLKRRRLRRPGSQATIV
jgi:MYXO-CTERM domain-containing protein